MTANERIRQQLEMVTEASDDTESVKCSLDISTPQRNKLKQIVDLLEDLEEHLKASLQ